MEAKVWHRNKKEKITMLGEEQENKHERFYLDNLEGPEVYIEVNWNDHAIKDRVIRLSVGKERVVVDSEDLETALLCFTRAPEKFLRNKSKQIGLKYMPVPLDQYRKYKRYCDEMKHKTGRIHSPDINQFPTVA